MPAADANSRMPATLKRAPAPASAFTLVSVVEILGSQFAIPVSVERIESFFDFPGV